MKTTLRILCVCLLLGLVSLQAQELTSETTFQFETLEKNCYLGEATIEDDGTIGLHYAQKLPVNTEFYSYYFDSNLNFIEEQQESYDIGDDLNALAGEIKNTFKWFVNDYQGETFTEDRLHVQQVFGGKIMVTKYQYTFAYGWEFGRYHPKVKYLDKMQITGAKAEKIYLYDWVQNNETGDAYLIAGVKAPKGSKAKFQHARKFQIIKVNKDFELEYLQTITFKYNMCISFTRVLSNEEPEETYEIDPEIPIAEDISRGPLAIVFSPVKSVFGKKYRSENPESQRVVLINPDGAIKSKINFRAKASGWAIEDFILSPDGNEFFLYGPAVEDAFVNEVVATNTPLTTKSEKEKVKWKSFQMLKVSNDKLSWVSNIDLKEFKEKVVTPPSQKKKSISWGRRFAKTMTYLSPEGEVFIGGQHYKEPGLINDEGKFKDLILLHFDNRGKLKAQYGVRRDKMNQTAKSFLTPQELILSPDGKSLLWVYGEIRGFRRGLSVFTGGVGTIAKSKLLYYPAVAKIDLSAGKINDFVMLGQDEKGKQQFYAHPDFSHLLSPDGHQLTFIGEDKKGTTIWLGRMDF